MDTTCTIDKQYSRVIDAFGYIIRDALLLNTKLKQQYWNQVQDDATKLPTDYATIMFSDGQLDKYTLDRNSYKQASILVVELISSKENYSEFKRTYDKLALLFHTALGEYNIQVENVNKSYHPNPRGHLFAITVEYNFILEKC